MIHGILRDLEEIGQVYNSAEYLNDLKATTEAPNGRYPSCEYGESKAFGGTTDGGSRINRISATDYATSRKFRKA